MSGQTSTPGAGPPAGCTKYASAGPAGVLIETSESFVSAALTTGANVDARPAPRVNAPNCRRDNPFMRKLYRTMSSIESWSHIDCLHRWECSPQPRAKTVDVAARVVSLA